MKTEPSLKELRKEVKELKKAKEEKLQLATSMTERNKLLKEINELNAVQKSPNALRSFKKEMKTAGKLLLEGINTASRNIENNSPELREFDKSMISQPHVGVNESIIAKGESLFHSREDVLSKPPSRRRQ